MHADITEITLREMGSLCRYYQKSHQCPDLPPNSLKCHLKKYTSIRKENLHVESKSAEKQKYRELEFYHHTKYTQNTELVKERQIVLGFWWFFRDTWREFEKV